MIKLKSTVIGMIHTLASPGTPKYGGSVDQIIETALKEASIYKKAGIDALGLENMHDIPYLKAGVGPEVTATMAQVASVVKKETGLTCGIQILAAANKEALAVALSANLDFIRVEGFVFGHVADEGIIESCAGELLRYRKIIGADNISIFTDIKKKHSSHAITADVDIAETAHAAEFFMSDGLIITGPSTGTITDVAEIESVKKSCKCPVLVGSGVNIDNIESYVKSCDGMIVGSYFKEEGFWENELSYDRVASLMEKVRGLR